MCCFTNTDVPPGYFLSKFLSGRPQSVASQSSCDLFFSRIIYVINMWCCWIKWSDFQRGLNQSSNLLVQLIWLILLASVQDKVPFPWAKSIYTTKERQKNALTVKCAWTLRPEVNEDGLGLEDWIMFPEQLKSIPGHSAGTIPLFYSV